MHSHFDLFGLAPAYALESEALERSYREIQSRVHPDRFAHAGDAERRASLHWTTRVNDRLTALDVRLILVTDDDQRIYMSYRGMVAATPADAATGQAAERYWRMLPIFETDSPKYDWLTRMMSVGVSYTVPQRVSYRVFQIL